MNIGNKFSNIFISLVLTGCAPSFFSTKNATTSSNCGAVSWWNGNHVTGSTAYDILGTNNGILNSSVQITSVGNANVLGMSARSSSISVPNTTTLNPASAMSISFWVYSNTGISTPTSQVALGMGSFPSLMNSSQAGTFDMSSINSSAVGYQGAVFDGRFIYYIPYQGSVVSRYDTRSTTAFTSSTSAWSTFDVSTVNAGLSGFVGGSFDGRYIYFAPYRNSSNYDGIVARYDTLNSLAFSSSGSAWTSFDLGALNANANGFGGSIFDGRYVYFYPNYGTAGSNGLIARYDTTSSLTFGSSGSAWAIFDISSVNASAISYQGAAFDGRYIYLTHNGTDNGIVARFDTTSTLSFSSSGAAWSVFDVSTLNGTAVGFFGATFDGKYLYLVPYQNSGGYDGVVARYDTTSTLPFGSSNSAWSFFDTTTVNSNASGFRGAVFDGKYIYFLPYRNGAGYNGKLTRFDTTTSLSFNSSASAWNVLDLSSINANAVGYQGAVFDGRSLYLSPLRNSGGAYSGLTVQYDTQAGNVAYLLRSGNTTSDGGDYSRMGPSFQVTTSAGSFQIMSASALNSNWHFITGTYDGNQIKLYVDASLVEAASASGAIITNSNPLTLGAYGSAMNSVTGFMNEIQFYGTSLSLSQIKTLYQAGNSGGLCQ